MKIQIHLQPELSNIKDKVDELLMEIDANAIDRGIFYSGLPVAAKGRRVPKLLESECIKLLDDYHKRQEVEKIKTFIESERERITGSFSKHSFTSPRYEEFDRRIDNLLKLISARALLRRKHVRKMPTWVSALLVGVITGLIVAALTPWVLEMIGQMGRQR